MVKRNKRGQGEGSIRQRKDGTWEARYTIGVDKTGKQIQRSIYSKDCEDLKKKLRKILTSMDEGIYVESKKIKVCQWLETWFEEYKKPCVKPNTLACYENIINKHINPVIGNVLLKDLRADHIQKLYNTVAKKYSKRMVELTHVTLHSALEQAIKNDLLFRNVSNLVGLPKGKDQRDGTSEKTPRVLSIEEQKALLKALEGERLEAAFLLLLFTGLRRGELLGLKWADIDFENKLLSVNRLLCRFKNYDNSIKSKTVLDYGTLKTSKSKRIVPLLDELIPILKTHRANQKAERLKAGNAYQKNDLVFCNEIGNPIDPCRLKAKLDSIVKKAGVSAVNIHALRHTFATRGLENGIELKVMQELLGHSTIVLTGDTYSHVLPHKKREAVEKLKNVFVR